MPVGQSAQSRETQGTGRGTFVPIVESSAASMISAASSLTMKRSLKVLLGDLADCLDVTLVIWIELLDLRVGEKSMRPV